MARLLLVLSSFFYTALLFSHVNPDFPPQSRTEAETFQAKTPPKSRRNPKDPIHTPSHFDPANRTYNIWEYNCHTAANAGVMEFPGAGIIVCGGDPKTSIAHHTANYIDNKDGTSCTWNWGSSCCWKTGDNSPDISTNSGKECAKKACGKQYGEGTKLLPPGELVEIPTINSCAREELKKSLFFQSYDSCLACCDDRADHWSTEDNNTVDNHTHWEFKSKYLQRCKKACDIVLNEKQGSVGIVDSLAVREGRKCDAKTKTITSCKTCCDEGKAKKYFPPNNIISCYAVCNGK